jgi:ankyrin repeat protein
VDAGQTQQRRLICWPAHRGGKKADMTEKALPHHERLEDPLFHRAVSLIDAGDTAALRLLLVKNPALIRQRVSFGDGGYFSNPGLLEFIAENPVRHGVLPKSIVDVATVLLEACPEPNSMNATLGLVASSRVARECDVQRSLLKVLCAHGADPNTALYAAAVHGEFEAVRKLISLGAKPGLPVAAALGDTDAFQKQLLTADAQQRRLALALAAQYGHAEMVRALLDAGEDLNRFNPVGAHGHSTPLHQAALAGHLEVVQLLVECGARLDVRDSLWQGTPADWAAHEGQAEVESYLRSGATK